MAEWQIPSEARKRILAGDHSPIALEQKPDLQEGQQIILEWLRPKAYADPELGRLQAPAKPIFWIVVTAISRKKKGGWSVAFDTFDHRDPVRWLRLDSAGVDPPERVDRATEKRFAVAAREREKAAAQELVMAAIEVREVARARLSSPEFRQLAGLSIRRLDKEIERMIQHTKKRAA